MFSAKIKIIRCKKVKREENCGGFLPDHYVTLPQFINPFSHVWVFPLANESEILKLFLGIA